MSDPKKFDVVVIGSGLGGLTAGAQLAKAGHSVLLLERNFSLGGAASVYRVGGLTIESSLHQTSDARNPRDVKHRILSELGVLDQLEFLPTGPVHSVRGGPLGEPFALPAGFDAAYDALATRFPDKRQAIQHFLNDVERIHDSLWTIREARDTVSMAKFQRALWELAPAAQDWMATLDEVMERHFGGAEALKCALGANLLYFGDDPARLWWIYYALAQGANIASGAAYIKGGSRQLSLKLAKVITSNGGTVRLGREATAILADSSGAARGVRHVARKTGEDAEEVSAEIVLANCAPSLAAEMLPQAQRAAMQEEFGARPLSTSLFSANFGLSARPDSVGLTDYCSIVLPASMQRFSQYGEGATATSGPPGAEPPLYAIANFTAVDSGLWDEAPFLVSVLGLDRLSNWKNASKEEALARREAWLDALQAALDRDHPGFSALVRERMMLNAHSMAGYLGAPEGAIYGFAPLPPDLPIVAGFPRTPHTPVDRLYLASAFGGEHGFNGAILSGAEAARLAARRLETQD